MTDPSSGRSPLGVVQKRQRLVAAVNPDPAEALEGARVTVACYGGVQQYGSFFEARGFGAEARRLQQAMQKRESVEAADLVPDAMARSFSE